MLKSYAFVVRALMLGLALLALQAAPAAAQQEPEVRVDRGTTAPLAIAVPAFAGQPYGEELAAIVRDNLGRSGYFAPIDPARYVGRAVAATETPAFADWRLINAQFLVSGQVTQGGDGRLRVDFRLWDVNAEQQVIGLQFTAPSQSWRRIGHKVSDGIYTRLTGNGPYFDTRIVFVSESGPRTNRRRVLTLMDQDGANPEFLTGGPEQVFTPRFSSSSQEVVYMALRDNGSTLYLRNLDTRRSESLGAFPGMVFAPRFSPDGSRIAFSVERSGNTDIYVMDLRSRQPRRITTDPSIDTSPSFSPDGSQIVFNSDRAGSPQLYIMGVDGSGQRRLSGSDGRYSTPVWSPTGDYIAFTKQDDSQFHVGVMKPDGSEERLLTTSYLDEGPTWAPNGQVLMFFRETPGGAPRLWTVDLQGRVQPAPQPAAGGSDPGWSPLLD